MVTRIVWMDNLGACWVVVNVNVNGDCWLDMGILQGASILTGFSRLKIVYILSNGILNASLLYDSVAAINASLD